MNPVFQAVDGKWYFWDECEIYDFGPYNTKEEAEKEMARYVAAMLEN